MATFEFIEWLLVWLFETSDFSFQWDKGNQTKNKSKHDIEITDIEEVFNSRLVIPLGIQVSPAVKEERLGIVGPTKKGVLLQVVFTLREGKVRPISARPAHKKERLQYAEILHKISERV